MRQTNMENEANGEAECKPGQMRLNKAIAASGYCSRRKADELIFSGRVKVNGQLANNPAIRISARDKLEVNDEVLKRGEEKIYLLQNKPAGVICTVKDPQGRRSVIDILPDQYKSRRLFPVGRLDLFSEGLLLLTNDGEFAQQMAHPRYHLPKTYEVTIRGNVDRDILKKMSSGMELEDGTQLLPIKVSAKTLKNGNTLLLMELRQGINRQIRRMCQQFQLVILRLRRTGQGPLRLGSLPAGQTRTLAESEKEKLNRIFQNQKESGGKIT